ncbi:MAG: BatA and WFA domain-containing protein, partial [Clostridia bacterium]|nr:BatA and WFA domain-containing protein [Clostridia bacterium]
MTFMYPLALLGLIGIPIVILIYILQSKYTEQTVTSTYIWKLSDRFLKRKNPFSGLTGLISLILQILLITAVSLAIARPTIIMPDSAYEYCFILDASCSMSAANEDSSRFRRAKDEIIEVIEDATGGSTYSLTVVSNEAEIVFVSVSDKDAAIDYINELQPLDTAATNEDLQREAQEFFNDHPSSLVYIVTDKQYSTAENVEVIRVGGPIRNYAVSNATFSHEGGTLIATADLTSYSGNADLTVQLYIDDQKVSEKTVSVNQNAPTSVTFENKTASFNSFRLQIANGDDYAADNQHTVYNLKSDKTYSTLIVSEAGFFLESVLDALLDSEVTTVTPKAYEEGIDEKYGLYIFDSYEPAELPDGAVWLINADSSIPNAGFGVRGKVDLGAATEIEKSASTSTGVRKLLTGVDGKGIHIVNYVKYSS